MPTLEITRQGVCAADDQIGPLDLRLEVAGGESIQHLIGRIVAEKFLQFSSSHQSITALSNGRELARVSAVADTEFLVDPTCPLVECLSGNMLTFRFQTVR